MGDTFGARQKSQAKPLFTLLVCIIIFSSVVFAEGIANSTNETGEGIIYEVTKIISLVFGNHRITAMLVLGNGTPVPNQELRFFENESALSSGITNESGTASVFYNSTDGEHNISVVFGGGENLAPSNISGIIFVDENETVPELIENETEANNTIDANITENNAASINEKNITVEETNTTANVSANISAGLNETGFGLNATNITANLSANMTAPLNESNITVEESNITQSIAEIGKPVVWAKKIAVKNRAPKNDVSVINISLDIGAENILVEETTAGKEILLKQKKSKGMGAASAKNDFEFNETFLPNEEKEYALTYSTPAPEKKEGENETSGAEWKKKVTVFSEYSYKNVSSYTEINEADISQIHLLWNLSGVLADVTQDPVINLTYIDSNNNGKIDMLYWNVPHLSEQEFTIIVDLTIINVQSYPTVGGNWTVRFNTTGSANLTISAIDGTTFGNTLPDDLEFLDLMCESSSLKKQLAFNAGGNALTYYDLYATREEIVARIAELNETINQMNGG